MNRGDITDLIIEDFGKLDMNLYSDYELYLISDIYSKILIAEIKKIEPNLDITMIENELENRFDDEFYYRKEHARDKLLEEEGFTEKIEFFDSIEDNIYYHVANRYVIETGIDISKGGCVMRDGMSLSVSPGYIYLFRSTRTGLDQSIRLAAKTNRMVVKIHISIEYIKLDADQVRFTYLGYANKTFEEAEKYFEKDHVFKRLIEKSPYRVTNRRIEKGQIIKVLYDPSLHL